MIIVEKRLLAGERSHILRTVNPILAEAHYFFLCKYHSLQDGSILVISDNDEVPNADFKCGSAWMHERKEVNDDRYHMIWATPLEGWRNPTHHMIQGIKKNILTSDGNKASIKYICDRLGCTTRSFSQWVTTSSNYRNKIRYTDWFCLKLLACL